MIVTINAAVIGCDMNEDFFHTSGNSKGEKFFWKKAYTVNKTIGGITQKFPDTQIVFDVDEIVNDAEINLVIVSKDHLKLAKPVMDAGIALRVI